MGPEQPLIQPEKYKATCRLCGQIFKAPPMNGPTDPRIQKMGEAFFKHMWSQDEAHKTYTVTCVIVAGFLLEDPAALQFAAGVRAVAFQALRRHYLPDEKLHDVISRLTPEQFESAMADMRDFLCEQGKYAVQIGAPPPAMAVI